MEKSERHALHDLQVLRDKRRKAAEKVRRLLAELEAAEREFNAVTRAITQDQSKDILFSYRRQGW